MSLNNISQSGRAYASGGTLSGFWCFRCEAPPKKWDDQEAISKSTGVKKGAYIKVLPPNQIETL